MIVVNEFFVRDFAILPIAVSNRRADMQHIVFLYISDILALDGHLPTNIFKYIQAIMRMDMKNYSTAEAAVALGISKNTLLRWIRERKVHDVKRDRNKWRIFTDSDIARIKKEIERASK